MRLYFKLAVIVVLTALLQTSVERCQPSVLRAAFFARAAAVEMIGDRAAADRLLCEACALGNQLGAAEARRSEPVLARERAAVSVAAAGPAAS